MIRLPSLVRRTVAAPTLAVLLAVAAGTVFAQAPKGHVSKDDPAPALTYHGLVPGLSTRDQVEEALGKPEFEAPWYDYKLYYPVEERPGLFDVVHMHNGKPDAVMADVEAASVPEGYATSTAIRERLGEPEYELRMNTFSLLDYGERGVRFVVDDNGATIGVAYVPHLYRRVPEGERSLVDLTHLRTGPQPVPQRTPDLNGLRVGTSEVDITPTGEDWLPHKYTVVTPLKARTAVFRDNDLTVAFIGADLFGMGRNDILVIRDAARELGIDYTVFGMSHNHAAPDTIGVYGHYPAEYIAYIQQQSIEGLKQALDRLKPVKALRVASKELPMDGARVQDLIRNARNPALLDPTISILQAIGQNDEPITTLVHFACHVESLAKGAREISADFPGYMCDQLKKNMPGQPVFLNGALGGMISGDNRERTHESSRVTGLRFAEIVGELAEWATSPASYRFRAEGRPVYIPMTNQNFVPLFESGLRTLHRGRVKTDMIYVELAGAQFVTLPGELLPEVSFEVLEAMEGYPRMLIGLANDQIGYMVPPYDFRDDYYEETMSQGPAAATQVRDMALRMITAGGGEPANTD